MIGRMDTINFRSASQEGRFASVRKLQNYCSGLACKQNSVVNGTRANTVEAQTRNCLRTSNVVLIMSQF